VKNLQNIFRKADRVHSKSPF